MLCAFVAGLSGMAMIYAGLNVSVSQKYQPALDKKGKNPASMKNNKINCLIVAGYTDLRTCKENVFLFKKSIKTYKLLGCD